MAVKGLEGMSRQQVKTEVQLGAVFVLYYYAFSVVVRSYRRGSDVFYIRPGQSRLARGVPYMLLTLLLGWWAFHGDQYSQGSHSGSICAAEKM